jgi:DNA-directed RNA polymerase specialized sigma24 family protein
VNHEEAEWISRCQQGDQDALKKIFDRYHKKVYSIAYGVLRQREDGGFQLSDDVEKRPDRILIHKELEERMKLAMGKLPADQRAAIIFREVEELSYQEIAEAMGCSIGTVMSRLHYGRKRMQKLLKDYVKEENKG